jgi:hypothetical protein
VRGARQDRSSSNQPTSSGWQTSTGARVVGRSTPGALTGAPTSELTSVDLPGPGRPADDHQQRRVHLPQPREQVVVDLARELVADVRASSAPSARRASGWRRSSSRRSASASGSAVGMGIAYPLAAGS